MKQDNNQEKAADKIFKKGKDALTTGVFQWKKDYTQGAMYFEDAAKLYKECKNAQKEKASLLLAIECNEKLNDTWAIGRNYEALINTYIENSSEEYAEIFDNTNKATAFFKVSDSGNKAISVFTNVSKYLIKKKQFDMGEQIIKLAMDEAEEQQLPSTRSDVISLYVELLMETSQYYKIADLYRKEIEKHKEESQKYPLHQWAMIIIIMLILQDEIIRASQELEQLIIMVFNFHKSSEFKAIDQMLNAYEKGDQKQFDEAVMRPIVTGIYPPSIVRILRKQKVRVIQIHQKQNLNQIDDEQQEYYKTELEKKIL